MLTGQNLGPYELLDKLGEGGMGEVYRARDTRLDRTVAIKVLSGALASDPQGRERFEREARAISQLNHPNICVLHDVGREGEIAFLVMEYVEGETLAARLARQSISMPQALDIAIQIASALDRAHTQGIVHRDLKPGNVMLTRSARPGAPATGGTTSLTHVKLLDFGLARLNTVGTSLTSGSDNTRGLVSIAELSMATMSSPLTMKGTILGTLHYMSPEQLEGKDVDARSDLFAFGVLLYEMLTGRRPFEGKSQASLIGAILDHTPPPIAAVDASAPPLLDDLVARGLAKNPDDRWQSARDLMRQLEWIAAHGASVHGSRTAEDATARPTVGRIARLVAMLAAAAALSGGAVAWMLWPKANTPLTVSRFLIELATDQALTRTGRRVVALSPDGTRLAYVANQQIYIRHLNELTSAPLAGTAATDPSEPVFSPDSQWLAFWSNGRIKKVPGTGGTPIDLGEAENPYGMSWEGDRLLLGQSRPAGIIAVPGIGGAVQRLVALDENAQEIAQSPQLLAGGKAILFTLRRGISSWDDASIVVQNLETAQRTVLIAGGTHGRALPTGHLVYARGSALFAAPFDEATLTVTGGSVPVLQDIELGSGGFSGTAQMASSATGSLLFIPSGVSGDRALMWMDRQGKLERATAPVRPYWAGSEEMRVSPDGTRVAMTVVAKGDDRVGSAGIWIWEIARNTFSRLSAVWNATSPVWTPDSRRVCYRDSIQVYCQAADGRGSAEALFKLDDLVYLGGISHDGRQLLLRTVSSKTRHDIALANLSASPDVRPLIQTPGDDLLPALSPDGRWLAYVTDIVGGTEVFVRPFPDVDRARWQISSGGGTDPHWSRDGRELFFLDVSGSTGVSVARAIMSVAVGAGPDLAPSKPVTVAPFPAVGGRGFDVGPDGRFLLHVPVSFADGKTAPRQQLVLVQHWFEELKARVPVTPGT